MCVLRVCSVYTFIVLRMFILVCDPVMGDNGAMVRTLYVHTTCMYFLE